MAILVIESLSKIFTADKHNDYSIFDDLVNVYGVYVFQTEQREVLYVGEAKGQDLKNRITQNFTEKDTGGTFRENYLEKTGQTFDDFKALISNLKIFCITLEEKSHIKTLEAFLILALDPEFNINT